VLNTVIDTILPTEIRIWTNLLLFVLIIYIFQQLDNNLTIVVCLNAYKSITTHQLSVYVYQTSIK